jgi:hypothetical protein
MTDLARQVELAVHRLDVLQHVAGDHLLVQPDLVVRRRPRQQVLAAILGKLVNLAVKLGHRRDRGDEHVPDK